MISKKSKPRRVERLGGSTSLAWPQFWMLVQEARGIGRVEAGIECDHCHDGRVIDFQALRGNDGWFRFAAIVRQTIRSILESRREATKRNAEKVLLLSSGSHAAQDFIDEVVAHESSRDLESVRFEFDEIEHVATTNRSLQPGSLCIIVDDSTYSGDTVASLILAAEEARCKTLAVVTPFYAAYGDADKQLRSLLKQHKAELHFAFAGSLLWFNGEENCPVHKKAKATFALRESSAWSLAFHAWLKRLPDPSQRGGASEVLLNRHFSLRRRNSAGVGATSNVTVAKFLAVVESWNNASAQRRKPRASSPLDASFSVAAGDLAAKLGNEELTQYLSLASGSRRLNVREIEALADLVNAIPYQLGHDVEDAINNCFARYKGCDVLLAALFRMLWELKQDRSDLRIVMGKLSKHSGAATRGEAYQDAYGSIVANILMDDLALTLAESLLPVANATGVYKDLKRDFQLYRQLRESGTTGEGMVCVVPAADNSPRVLHGTQAKERIARAATRPNTIVCDFVLHQLRLVSAQGRRRIVPAPKRKEFTPLLNLAALACLADQAGVGIDAFQLLIERRGAYRGHTRKGAQKSVQSFREAIENGSRPGFLITDAQTICRQDDWTWMILDRSAERHIGDLIDLQRGGWLR